jgi:L-asparaginase/Glu-tRNA(Gln) amidotransferase subunit D
MAVNVDLFRGDSLPVSIELISTSSAGEAAFDLTGYSVTVSLRWPKCQTLNLTSSSSELTIVSTAGTIAGTFAATATSTLPNAMKEYLILETTAGVKQTYFIGRVNVLSCESSTELCFNG